VYHDRRGFTKALALEVAQWVTVNTISPGYIGTKMVMAIPKDVLDANSPSDPAQPPGKAGGDRGPHHLPLLG
jgi:acetoacetyl-CoA reductase